MLSNHNNMAAAQLSFTEPQQALSPSKLAEASIEMVQRSSLSSVTSAQCQMSAMPRQSTHLLHNAAEADNLAAIYTLHQE